MKFKNIKVTLKMPNNTSNILQVSLVDDELYIKIGCLNNWR
jgi:hypothetical protein